MTTEGTLDQGRASVARRQWGAAYRHLSAADGATALEPPDLETLAVAAQLVGRFDDGIGLWTRAHHERLARGDLAGAARCAFWLAQALQIRGEAARAGGWAARGHGLVEELGRPCAEEGLLLLPGALRDLMQGNGAPAYAAFRRAAEIGARFADRDLTALANLGRGQSLIVLVLSGRAHEIPFRIDGRAAHAILPVLWFVANHVLVERSPLGRKTRPAVRAHGGPLIRVKRADLAAAGVEHVEARTVGTEDGKPVLEGGRVVDVRNVVWCTGFGKDTGWIGLPVGGDDGWPYQERGRVPALPGLYFVGLPFLYAFASMLIGGVGRDAEHVADHIASRAPASTPAPASAPGPGSGRSARKRAAAAQAGAGPVTPR